MQRALLFLLLVLSVMIVNKNVYSDDLQVCPFSIEKTGITSCSDLCNYIASHIRPAPWAPFDRVVVQSAEVRPAVGQGYRNQSLCTCHLQGITDYGVVVWDSSCTYRTERTNPLPMILKGVFAQGNVVNNFIKAALFLPVEVKGDNRLNSIFLAIQNLYLSGLQQISDKVALILLVILFSFSIARIGITRIFTVLKGDKEAWGIPTSAEWKEKAFQVAIALTFFMFPLPASLVLNVDKGKLENYRRQIVLPDFNSTAMILKQCGAEWDRYIEAEQNFYMCMSKYQNAIEAKGENDVFQKSSQGMEVTSGEGEEGESFFDLVSELIDIISNIDNTGSFHAFSEIVGKVTNLQDVSSNYVKQNFSSTVNGISYCYDEFRQKETAFQNLRACFLANGGSEENWDNFVFANIQNEKIPISYTPHKRNRVFGLPLAVALVKGFVQYGVGLAEKLSRKANAGLMEYLAVRISDEKGWFRTGLETLKTDQGDLNPVVVSSGACKISCSDVLIGNDLQLRREHPECIPILDQLKKTCSEYNKMKEEKMNAEKIEFATDDDVREVLATEVDTLEKTFGWLSTGMIPVVGVLSPVLGSVKEQQLSKTYAYLQDSTTQTLQSIDEDAILWDGYEYKKDKGVNSLKATYTYAKSITDSPSAFLLGMGVTYASTPPGKWFKKEFEDMSQTTLSIILKGVSVVLSFLLKAPISTPQIVEKLSGKMLGLIATCVVALLILKIIPYISIVLANILRFIAYLFEIIKSIICVPFWGVVTATTRAKESLNFFKHIVKLMFIPPLIVASSLFAFFGIEVLEFFLVRIPLSLIFSAVGTQGTIKAFMLGVVSAVFIVIVKFVSVWVGFMIAYSFPEKVIESVSSVLSHKEGKEIQIFQSPAIKMFKV